LGQNEKPSPQTLLVCNTSISRTRSGTFDGGQRTFANGCHVIDVEIDQATGAVALVRYHAVAT